MLYFQSVLYPTWCICLLAYWPWYIELYRLRIHMSCSGSWQGGYPFAGCSSEWFCQPVERTPVPNFLHLMLTWKRCMFPVHTAAVLISLTTKTFSDPRGSHVGGKIGTTEDRAGGGGSLMRSPGSRQSCRYWPAVSKVPPLFETLPTWPGRVSSHPDSAWGPHTMTLPYVSQQVLALQPHTMTLPCVLPAWPHLMFPNMTSSSALPLPTFPFSSTQIPMWVTQTQQQDSLPQSDSWQWFCLLYHQYFKDQAHKPFISLFEDCQWKHQELEYSVSVKGYTK